MARKVALGLIKIYQKTLSPDYGWFKIFYPLGYCKFQPSCSMYMHQAIEKYGVIKGVGMGIWRILRCNPWNHGGRDDIPNIKIKN